jgi:WD40 repeat protein
VGFSPDGQLIVSGSDDETICVWNAMTGEMVAGPFTGHTDPVTSVEFSSDGQWIVSGSGDQNLCVWNARTGEMVAGPFAGHTDLVNSVGFSPDGQLIVSGSGDQTIRMWNLNSQSRDMMAGHMDLMRSVGVTSDGNLKQMVSSEDKSIYVLDSMTDSDRETDNYHTGQLHRSVCDR